MAKIACVLAHGFEDVEFSEPFQALRAAGHQVDVIGIKPSQELAGKRGKVTLTTDKSFDQAKPSEYDALFIPGGHSPDNLRAHEGAVRFVAELDRTGKTILSICHGPQLLMAARRVRGRTLTAWRTIQDDLRLVEGVTVRDEPVVVDRNWVTSREPDDIPQFIDASLQRLRELEGARPEAR